MTGVDAASKKIGQTLMKLHVHTTAVVKRGVLYCAIAALGSRINSPRSIDVATTTPEGKYG